MRKRVHRRRRSCWDVVHCRVGQTHGASVEVVGGVNLAEESVAKDPVPVAVFHARIDTFELLGLDWVGLNWVRLD